MEYQKINPAIDRKTGKPFAWENPNFTPGKHCTSCRYAELTEPRNKDFPYICSNCIITKDLLGWKKRSDAAKRAAITRKRNVRKAHS